MKFLKTFSKFRDAVMALFRVVLVLLSAVAMAVRSSGWWDNAWDGPWHQDNSLHGHFNLHHGLFDRHYGHFGLHHPLHYWGWD